ncbi:MAG: hypothetical protein EHM23_34225 [Acidobacteria bacterium]|nr:MAG: hypothetical protein EHM23_34225 [Acidobacteriota bacterium]
MQISRIVLLFIVSALCGSFSFAQKGCQKPFEKWDEAYALKILTNSAWSKQMALGREFSAADRLGQVEGTDKGMAIGSDTSLSGNTRGLDRGTGVAGEKEIIHSYTVRLFSAMPIREAFVRLFQIRNNYDQMPDGQRKQLDTEFEKALTMDVSRNIVVTVSLDSNDRELNMEVDRQLHQATLGSLKQDAYLIADKQRVALEDYRPPSRDGAGAKLLFPRTIDGRPVVGPTMKELALEFFVPGVKHKIYVQWKVKDLLCQDQLIL